MRLFLASLIFVFLSSAAMASDLPEALEKSLSKAHATKDPYILNAVKEQAKKDHPQHIQEITAWGAQKQTQKVLAKAHVKEAEKKAWWKPKGGEVEASANFSFGNSEQQEYFFSTKFDHAFSGGYENSFSFESQNREEEGVRTEEEYMITNQTRQTIDDRNYNFLELEAEKDRFSGIDFRISELIGRGHVFTKTDDVNWSGELAAGMTQTAFTDGEETSSAAGRVTSKFDWNIFDGFLFRNVSRSTVTGQQVFSEIDTSIETKLYKDLALRASLDIDHNTDVPDDAEETDIDARVGIVYGF